MKYASLAERILANSVVSPYSEDWYNGTACWLWVGRTSAGYPMMSMRYKKGPRKGKHYTVGAHRMSIVAFKNLRMTPRMVARHLCNNRLCVNPDHLAGGTQKQNIKQCVKEGRHKTPFRKESKGRE